MKSRFEKQYRQIGRNIAYYRKTQGLTQEQLADSVGISLSYLTKIEAPNSVKTYSLDVLFAIAEALGQDIKVLMDFTIKD